MLIVELKAAGLYDEKSQIEIKAQLTNSQVNAGIKVGTAKLAAIFTVDKADIQVFEKRLSVETQWESSFVGVIAVPEAINQYTSLYNKLVGKLFDDKEFRAVMSKKGACCVAE